MDARVFGKSVALRDLHAVLLGEYTRKSFNAQALIDTGESLSFAALQLVARAADPNSAPIVAMFPPGRIGTTPCPHEGRCRRSLEKSWNSNGGSANGRLVKLHD